MMYLVQGGAGSMGEGMFFIGEKESEGGLILSLKR